MGSNLTACAGLKSCKSPGRRLKPQCRCNKCVSWVWFMVSQPAPPGTGNAYAPRVGAGVAGETEAAVAMGGSFADRGARLQRIHRLASRRSAGGDRHRRSKLPWRFSWRSNRFLDFKETRSCAIAGPSTVGMWAVPAAPLQVAWRRVHGGRARLRLQRRSRPR